MRLLLDTHIALWAIADDRRLSAKARTLIVDPANEIIVISPAHVIAIETLPMLHANPFDRILVAQALNVPLRLLTHDPQVASYSDSIIAV